MIQKDNNDDDDDDNDNIIRQCLDSEPHHWNWTNDYVYMGMAINIIEWLMPLGARPPSIKNVNKILWRNVCIL